MDKNYPVCSWKASITASMRDRWQHAYKYDLLPCWCCINYHPVTLLSIHDCLADKITGKEVNFVPAQMSNSSIIERCFNVTLS